MFYDPYDDEVQVKFHRTDPTGRSVPLDTDTDRRNVLIARACVALAVLVACAVALVVLQ